MQLGINVDIDEAIKKLDLFRKEQLPYALSVAINDTAVEAKEAIKDEMSRVFDNPTDWTLNSLYVRKGSKSNPAARVWIKNFAAKGPSPEDWLKPEILGGQRNLKRMEKALQHKGLLPPGMVIYPTKYADLDAKGNIKQGQVVQIMSYLNIFGEQGYKANMDKAGRKRFTSRTGHAYFVGKPKGKIAGIWKRVNFAVTSQTAVVPIFYFIPSPTYKPRLDFYGVANKTFSSRFQENFNKAMKHAIETAR